MSDLRKEKKWSKKSEDGIQNVKRQVAEAKEEQRS